MTGKSLVFRHRDRPDDDVVVRLADERGQFVPQAGQGGVDEFLDHGS